MMIFLLFIAKKLSIIYTMPLVLQEKLDYQVLEKHSSFKFLRWLFSQRFEFFIGMVVIIAITIFVITIIIIKSTLLSSYRVNHIVLNATQLVGVFAVALLSGHKARMRGWEDQMFWQERPRHMCENQETRATHCV